MPTQRELYCVYIPGKPGDAETGYPAELAFVERLPLDTAFSVYVPGVDFPVTFVIGFADDSLGPIVSAVMRDGLFASSEFGAALDRLKSRLIDTLIRDYAILPDFAVLFRQSGRRMGLSLARELFQMLGNELYFEYADGSVKFSRASEKRIDSTRNTAARIPCICCPGGDHITDTRIELDPLLPGTGGAFSPEQFIEAWLAKYRYQGIEGRRVRLTIEVVDVPDAPALAIDQELTE